MTATIIEIVLKIAGWLITKDKDKKSGLKSYIAFVGYANKAYGESARLRQSYQDQLERLKAELGDKND